MKKYISFIRDQQNKIIELRFDYKIQGIYSVMKNVYSGILNYLFNGKNIIIASKDSLDSSIIYEFGNVLENVCDQKRVIMIEILNTNQASLESIANSEDFELGVLYIIQFKTAMIKSNYTREVCEIIARSATKNTYSEEVSVCFCESDGYRFRLENTDVSEEKIFEIVDLAIET